MLVAVVSSQYFHRDNDKKGKGNCSSNRCSNYQRDIVSLLYKWKEGRMDEKEGRMKVTIRYISHFSL